MHRYLQNLAYLLCVRRLERLERPWLLDEINRSWDIPTGSVGMLIRSGLAMLTYRPQR
jgi:hypothetical protein